LRERGGPGGLGWLRPAGCKSTAGAPPWVTVQREGGLPGKGSAVGLVGATDKACGGSRPAGRFPGPHPADCGEGVGINQVGRLGRLRHSQQLPPATCTWFRSRSCVDSVGFCSTCVLTPTITGFLWIAQALPRLWLLCAGLIDPTSPKQHPAPTQRTARGPPWAGQRAESDPTHRPRPPLGPTEWRLTLALSVVLVAPVTTATTSLRPLRSASRELEVAGGVANSRYTTLPLGAAE
jgi:hypothetical protein